MTEHGERFKVAMIGSHGVGKTTLCYGLAARLKALDLSVEVVHEVARRCPLPINQETSKDAQGWILHSQIAEELVASHRYPLVVCDRSALDNYVYLLLAEGRQPLLDDLVSGWLPTYDLLVYIPILAGPSPDGVRSPDPTFQRAVDERLRREVERRGLSPLRLDPEDRSSWLERVETEVRRRVDPGGLAQLPLLEPESGILTP